MNKGSMFVYGLIVGAAAGLLFAPQSGRATRAFIRDKARKYSGDVADYSSGKARHLANKARGYAHNVKESLAHLGAEETQQVKTYM